MVILWEDTNAVDCMCGSMFGWARKEHKVDSVFIISHLWSLSVITKAAQRKEQGVFTEF